MRHILPALLLVAGAQATLALARDGACRIQPSRGASTPQGADVKASMVNNGQSCAFPNFGIPDERANPADSGKIIRAPSAGKSFFQAPFAVYMPTPGFAGTDSFEYEASAAGRGGAPLRLVVRVTIEVSAP